jgi:hypothetical protein
MISAIPVSFEYEGIQFDGYFTNNHGAGFDRYHLILNGVHYGSLIISDTGWRWAAGPGNMFTEPYMVVYFIEVVVAWYTSKLS